MSRMALSALSFCFVIIVPLQSYDEPNVSLIQTTQLVRVSLTGNRITLRTTFCTRAIMRPLLFSLGWLLFGVGFIGVFVPVLPTTPLMLLALWCFSRSSDRFHAWLYTHKLFGPPLQQWHQFRVIPLTAKFIAILFMIGSLVYMFVFLTTPVWAKTLMSISMAFGFWYILTKPSFPPKK